MNEREANETRLSLPCAAPLPKRRRALAAAEWVWREKRAFPKSDQELFAAQFVLGEDPGDSADIDEVISELGSARGQSQAAVAQRDIIEPEGAFQARLRGWLRGE